LLYEAARAPRPVKETVVALALAAPPACTLFVLALAQGLIAPDASAVPSCSRRVGFTADDAEPETAAALAAGLGARDVGDRGATWVGRLPSVGNGRRDTIIHVPTSLDRARPVELVVFMDGFASFGARTMETRHVAAIAALDASGANAVYVAPDAPSSRFGDRTASGPYWQAGCARRACAGGHAAAGDFAAFYRDVVAHVDRVTCASAEERAATRWQLVLIGFSNGGRGVHDAIVQLADPRSPVRLADVVLTRVVYADAVYGTWWLDEAWVAIRDLPELVEVTVLLQAGGFERADAHPGHGNRARAWAFARRWLGAGRPPPAHNVGDVVLDRVRLRRLALDHTGIGDRAHETVAPPKSGSHNPGPSNAPRGRPRSNAAGGRRSQRGDGRGFEIRFKDVGTL